VIGKKLFCLSDVALTSLNRPLISQLFISLCTKCYTHKHGLLSKIHYEVG